MPTSPPNLIHMPIYIANDLGYYKADGPEIELLSFALKYIERRIAPWSRQEQ